VKLRCDCICKTLGFASTLKSPKHYLHIPASSRVPSLPSLSLTAIAAAISLAVPVDRVVRDNSEDSDDPRDILSRCQMSGRVHHTVNQQHLLESSASETPYMTRYLAQPFNRGATNLGLASRRKQHDGTR